MSRETWRRSSDIFWQIDGPSTQEIPILNEDSNNSGFLTKSDLKKPQKMSCHS